MHPNEYWDYSLDEIDLWQESRIIKQKDDLMKIQSLATLITNGVALCLTDKTKPLSIEDLYPDLFREEKANREKLEEEQQMLLHKAKMDAFMNRFNSQRR